MVSRVIPVDPFDLIVFGGTGDLARRKIIPALFRRFCASQITAKARIIGVARRSFKKENYLSLMRDSVIEFSEKKIETDNPHLIKFLKILEYVEVDIHGDAGWNKLSQLIRRDVVTAYYFSVAPNLFGEIAYRLNKWEIATPESRIVIEKPFGHNLSSAKKLNSALSAQFTENQIYRIDHYLGKETVQNLMAVRFGNLLFEPLWNSQYVDHIQITVSETVGVGGRGAYYDQSGAMRDMVQNHLMQLLCLIAMEPPSHFNSDAVRDEKLKVIRALGGVEAHHVVRGQYDSTKNERSYRQDVENNRSFTESYLAIKVAINNWRWSGVPFYLRTGKKLKARSSEIAIVFKTLPHSIFEEDGEEKQNILAIQLQPNEGMTLDVTIKEPGPGGMRLIHVPLDMTFAEALGDNDDNTPDAYERLIMDVIRGNQTLFMRGDEVEAAWMWTDPIIKAWQDRNDVPKLYDVGGMGPDDAIALISRDGRRWRDMS